MPSEHKTDVKIRYAETDQMGTVHHAAYAVYLEQARTEHLEALGLPYHLMEARGVLLPVIELRMAYLKPALYGQTIQVVSRIFPVKGVRLRVEYEVFHEKDLILTGHSVHAFIGRDRKPMPPPKDVSDKLDFS